MSTPPDAPRAPRRRPRAVTVPSQGFGLSGPLISSPCRLAGWSLYAASGSPSGIAASLQGAAAAGATLTMNGFGAVGSVVVTPAAAWPAGANVVTVNNVSGGPVVAQIEGGTANPVVITFLPPIGVTGTPTAVVPVIAGGPAYTIDATGIGFGGNFAAEESLAEIMDGGQMIGAVAMIGGISNTEWLGDEGIYVGTSLALNVITGSFLGVLYVIDDWHGGTN